MEAILGPALLHGDVAETVSTSQLRGVVGVYFSAHWCGPCRAFTPQLRKVYERARAKRRAFNVVFVSSDRDEQSFKDYFGTMPWHAVPFMDRSRQQQLSMLFQVRGIPSLVFLDDTGRVLDLNARSRVMKPSFISTLPRLIDLSLPEHSDPVPILIRYQGKEWEVECEPSEGWEMLRMQIYSMTEVPAEQMKLFGLGLQTGLLDESVPLTRAVARGLLAQKGSGLRLANVPADARKASSVHSASLSHQSGTMDSASAWCSLLEDRQPWYQMDLGDVKDVSGVVLAARRDSQQWVTRFTVAISDAQDGPWCAADEREFDGPEYLCDSRAVFQRPVSARFVRIEPLSHNNHCALRADVLLADGAEPDKLPAIVVLSNFSAGDPDEFATEAKVDSMLEQQHLAFLQAKLCSLPPKLQHQVSSLQTVQRYEQRELQCQALNEIPVCSIDHSIEGAGYELSFMKRLLHWYKHGFFTWTNSPRCEHCGSTSTKTVGSTKPTPEEEHFLAFQVEIAQCSSCGGQTRFPRYNDPAKLLETRTGRCGEWANCFTLICRSLGFEARHVHDWTDHVWTEVYSDTHQRWLHVDSCEAAFDSPLMYEKGWGKKLTYCIAFARDHVVDVTRRYTQKFEEVLSRRTACTEQELAKATSAMAEFALERSLGAYPEAVKAARQRQLTDRGLMEEAELAGPGSGTKPEEEVGRTSGDAAWREQRGELGANDAAKQKALECSETGLAKIEPGGGGYSSQSGSSQDAQAIIRSRVTKLMDGGLSANDAILKVLADAKK